MVFFRDDRVWKIIMALFFFAARSIASKTKSDGSQVKESTDSSTTIEDEDAKGRNETELPKAIT